MTALILISWVAVRELAHERAFYILMVFCVASLGFSLLLGQMTYTEQSKLTLDFMLGFIHVSMILFSIFMGISLFQRELASGSVSLVLSKPVSRTTFLVGKFLGQFAVQILLVILMGTLTLIIGSWYDSPTFSARAVFQTLALIALESGVLATLTYLFAVLAGPLTTAIATIAVFVLGHSRTLVSSTLKSDGELTLWRAIQTVIPDLEIFNMKQLASYGHSIDWSDFMLASLYATVCIGFYLAMASICFHKKDILT